MASLNPPSPGDTRDELKERTTEEHEEEMVVADMSGLAPRRPILFPVFDAARQMDEQAARLRTDGENPPVDIDREGFWAAVKGALGASLLIWLVYALGFGLFIFVLTSLFRFL